MKTRYFIKEKLYFLLFTFITCVIMLAFQVAVRVNITVIIILQFLLWFLFLMTLVVEYVRRASYYNNLNDTLGNLDRKYLLTEIIGEPDFYDGKILYETLRIVDKSMHDHVNAYKFAQTEYKDFVEMWVHEIKTPLAASKLIISNNPSAATQSIHEEIEKVESYIDQALFYARSTAVEKDYIIKKLQLQTSVSKVIRKHAKEFIYKKIKIELGDLSLYVYSDNKWFEFILEQIISNALKYTQDNGRIDIYTTHKMNMIALHIKDNGIGIPASDLSRIFDKGFTGSTGRTNEKATGIGLYLCQTLCKKLYIGIEATSKEGEGTILTLNFPTSKLMKLK